MLDILVSYAYWNDKIPKVLKPAEGDVRLLIDSGAFTAFKTGRTIELDDYCKFLDGLRYEPWRYFTLDVIGDPDKTKANYEVMLERGLNPIPIFTKSDDIKNLDEMYETSDLIGFGGIAEKYGKRAEGYLKYVLRHVGDRKVHLLGYSSLKWIKSVRPYSCDSTTWANGGRYGSALVYMGYGKTHLLNRPGSGRTGDCSVKPPAKVMDRIRSFGLDPSRLQDDEQWCRSARLVWAINIISWIMIQSEMRSKIGTSMFLACGPSHLSLLIEWYNHTKKVGLLNE